MGVTREAAKIAFQPVNDLFTSGVWDVVQQVGTRHDHSRRAVPALQRVALPKAFLNRMQAPLRLKPSIVVTSEPSA